MGIFASILRMIVPFPLTLPGFLLWRTLTEKAFGRGSVVQSWVQYRINIFQC